MRVGISQFRTLRIICKVMCCVCISQTPEPKYFLPDRGMKLRKNGERNITETFSDIIEFSCLQLAILVLWRNVFCYGDKKVPEETEVYK